MNSPTISRSSYPGIDSQARVFVNIGLSLDGDMAQDGLAMEKWDNSEFKKWGAKWGALMGWRFDQGHFRENLRLGAGGGDRPGERHAAPYGAAHRGQHHGEAHVRRRRAWPAEEAPYHTPVFVLTHEERDPWVRPGGTAFFFVSNGPERVLELARQAVGDTLAL